MTHFDKATLRFDGACKSNPGPGGAGYIIFDNRNGKIILRGRWYLGRYRTNNIAEYFGLIAALEHLRNNPHITIGHLEIEGDSKLVINQMKGVYGVRNYWLRQKYYLAKGLLSRCNKRQFRSFNLKHIRRDSNALADKLANEAIRNECDWSECCL
jgi:ribonuclease HI